MEEFNPEKLYHPEDEYEALDGAQDTVPQAAPVQEPAAQPTVQPRYAEQQAYQPPYPPRHPVISAAPQQNGYPQQPPRPAPPQPAAFPYQDSYHQPFPQQPQPIRQPYPQQAPPEQPPYQQQVFRQPPVKQPEQQQYQQPSVPYAPAAPNPYYRPYPQQSAQPANPKPATPTGTKVFIIILCALLAAMVIGFVVYIAASANNNDKNNASSENGGFSINGGDEGIEINPFGGNNLIQSGSYTDVEEEITLKADNGDTQKRDDDNKDSVGTPDEKAEDITLNPLPKDKDDEKYTTQSAYESVGDSVVTVVCYEEKITDNDKDIVSQGTGTIISEDGYLITNAHVIGNSRAYAVNIVLNNSKEYQAKIIGYDTWTDLAVLKIDAEDLKAVSFGDSELIEIGQDVIAIGSPGGKKFQNSLTKGIVSAVDRELSINKYVHYIQSDAAISPGNSGGPLCNIYGQVIGITTAKSIATYYENMTFSIPSATVEEIVGDLMRYGYVKGRVRIGISGTEISSEEYYYYGAPAGVIINTIDQSGSVAGTKIKENDIITELDGQEITSFQDIYDVLADHKEGDKISIKVKRQSK